MNEHQKALTCGFVRDMETNLSLCHIPQEIISVIQLFLTSYAIYAVGKNELR